MPTDTSQLTPKGHRTRELILAAAAEQFAARGYTSTGMVAISDAAGVSMGGLYRYFTSKDELFSTVLAGSHRRLVDAVDQMGTGLAADPAAGLCRINHEMLVHWVREGGLLRAGTEASLANPRLADADRRALAELVERITRRLAMADGPFRFSRPQLDRRVGVLIAATRHACLTWDLRDDEAIAGAAAELGQIWYAALSIGR